MTKDIGEPTQTMCVRMAIIVFVHENGPRRTSESGITTQYITR
jgi:hypothetical protein